MSVNVHARPETLTFAYFREPASRDASVKAAWCKTVKVRLGQIMTFLSIAKNVLSA
jgi:hypothetical protein